MNNRRRIRVLIVDDSIMFREILARSLARDPGIEVVGTATDAYMARDKIVELKPDVLTLDIEMPRMSGIEFLRQLMPQYPLPVVVVSGFNEGLFDALDAGAVDFVSKPEESRMDNMETFINEMIIKIKIASTAKVGHFKGRDTAVSSPDDLKKRGQEMLIAIGASTGGTEAILEVIRDLPREVPGIVIVQHMPPVFTRMYAERLNNTCRIEVREAKDGDAVMPGRALLAPGGFQMKVVKERGGYAVRCFEGEKVNGHAPSVGVLFDSVAQAAGANAVGIILTGMGADGAEGLLKMRQKGAYTLGQDEKTCVVYGMPMVARNIGAVARQCPLTGIAGELTAYLRQRNIL